MDPSKMEYREFGEYLAGLILTSLIKGQLLDGVFQAMQAHTHWLQANTKDFEKPAKKKVKRARKISEAKITAREHEHV